MNSTLERTNNSNHRIRIPIYRYQTPQNVRMLNFRRTLSKFKQFVFVVVKSDRLLSRTCRCLIIFLRLQNLLKIRKKNLATLSCTYVPSITESGLGQQEYQNVLSNVVDLTIPSPAQPDSSKKQRAKRKPYTHFTDEERAKISKYAAENGNSNAIKHFEKDFPGLNESTVRNFKKKYYSQLSDARRKGKSTVTAIPSKVRGRPPVLMELDEKLIWFIKGIRGRGGVINIHGVRAVTQALIASNPSMVYLSNFDMPRSWVHSIYKRMGLKIRAGTTSRPPFPYG